MTISRNDRITYLEFMYTCKHEFKIFILQIYESWICCRITMKYVQKKKYPGDSRHDIGINIVSRPMLLIYSMQLFFPLFFCWQLHGLISLRGICTITIISTKSQICYTFRCISSKDIAYNLHWSATSLWIW